jgi:hypothetical protein
MTRSLKWFVLFLILAAAAHFTLTSVYSFYTVSVPSRLRGISSTYSVPLFHQNWKMFAPDVPEYDAQLEYRYPGAGGWSDWGDVSGSNGFGRRSRIEYMEQSLASSISWQIANNLYSRNARVQFDQIVSSFEYNRTIYFAAKLHEQSKAQALADSMQLRVKFRFTPAMKAAHSYQMSYLEFPVYHFPNE